VLAEVQEVVQLCIKPIVWDNIKDVLIECVTMV